MRFLSGALVLMLVAGSASAQPWYVRGVNGWDTLADVMTDQGGGHYTASITGLFDLEPFEYKIATADWSTAMPGSNGRVYSDATGAINFHLYDQTSWDDGWSPNNSRRVGYEDPGLFGWEIVGSFNGWSGTHDPNFELTDIGDGLYRGTFAFDAGLYNFKFRSLASEAGLPNNPGVWDTSIGTDFGNSAGDIQLAVQSDGDPWTFELDLPNGRWRKFTTAPPPGQDRDYNNSGFVDAADYTVWRNNLGTSNVLPNNPDGVPITNQHYNTWKANYGQGVELTWLVQSPSFATQQLVSVGGNQYEFTATGLTPDTDHDVQVVRSNFTETAPGSLMKVHSDPSGNINLNFFDLQGAAWNDGWSPNAKDRVGYEDHGYFDWEIVGSFNGWSNTNDPAFALVDQGGGLHTGTFTFNTPGEFLFKFRRIAVENPWSTTIGDDFGNAAMDNPFTVTNAGEIWHFELDLPNGRWRAYLDGSGAGGLAVPEPGTLLLVLMGLSMGAAIRRRS